MCLEQISRRELLSLMNSAAKLLGVAVLLAPFLSWNAPAQEYAASTRATAAYSLAHPVGRKIRFMSVDNGCDSGKALPLARKLMEEDGVLLLFSTLGTESNLAIRDYLNEKKVPQLFLESSSAVFGDPAHYPWTMGFFATYRTEARAYARYILQNKPAGKIAVLAANDDVGREFVAG